MSSIITEYGTVISQKEIAAGIYDMLIHTAAAGGAAAGQFVSLYSKDKAHLLPRPISLCRVDKTEYTLRLVYRVAGYGTEEFSQLTPGSRIRLMGPLGNAVSPAPIRTILTGGGIGIPPMLELAAALRANCAAYDDVIIVLGYRDELFLTEDFEKLGRVYIATEDGSCGVRGNVLDCIRENGLSAEAVYACGPRPMLRAVKAYADETGTKCFISLEERMACGIGACLGCVCASADTDEHSNVKNKRVCADGPFFEAGEVEL